MPKFRYDTSGQWYKGNTHIHSTLSDGGKTLAELAKMYAGVGYDFLFRTDHWVTSDVAADAQAYPLLWLDGNELHGTDHTGAEYHVVCLGSLAPALDPHLGLEGGMAAARAQGALLILAHPHWCHNSLPDAVRHDFDGVEIYNHVCHWMNGKSCGLLHWDVMLQQRPNTLGFAADDTHLNAHHPSWNGGWIMVNAPALTRPALLAAIRAGNFYSSCGPSIFALTCDGSKVSARTSPVKVARIVSPGYPCAHLGTPDSALMTEFTLPLPATGGPFYLDLEDEHGRRAWSNPLLLA